MAGDSRAVNVPLRRAAAYAAKFRADNGPSADPTDELMRASFAHCARVPEPEWFPAIRAAIAGERLTEGARP